MRAIEAFLIPKRFYDYPHLGRMSGNAIKILLSQRPDVRGGNGYYKVVECTPSESDRLLLEFSVVYQPSRGSGVDMDCAMMSYIDWKYGQDVQWEIGDPLVDTWDILSLIEGDLSVAETVACDLLDQTMGAWRKSHQYMFYSARLEPKDGGLKQALGAFIEFVKEKGKGDARVDALDVNTYVK